jgi:hypothetical protein
MRPAADPRPAVELSPPSPRRRAEGSSGGTDVTHTYLRTEDDEHQEYQVGQWLINREGYHQFNHMFTVPSLKQAIVAINALNGGQRISPDALHITKEK